MIVKNAVSNLPPSAYTGSGMTRMDNRCYTKDNQTITVSRQYAAHTVLAKLIQEYALDQYQKQKRVDTSTEAVYNGNDNKTVVPSIKEGNT